jgi:Antitoxin VbhA
MPDHPGNPRGWTAGNRRRWYGVAAAPPRHVIGEDIKARSASRLVPADVVTAGRIGFMGELRDKYPQHFGILGEARAQALEFAIANNVLEGWEPNEDDIRDLCEATAGHLSDDEVLRRGLDRLQRNRADARPS